MADYQLIFSTSGGPEVDVTERVSMLSWSGSIRQVSRELSVSLVTPRDGSLGELPCALGTRAVLRVDGAPVFLGEIAARERGTDASLTEVTALDRGRFLSGNEGWYQFRTAAPEAAVRAVCADFGVPVGRLAPTGVTVSRKFPGAALSQIVDTLYTLAGEQNGRRYLARMDGQGRLEVVEKPTAASLEIAPGATLLSLWLTESLPYGDYPCTATVTALRDGEAVGTVEIAVTIHSAYLWNL